MSKKMKLVCEPHQIIDASHALTLSELRIIQVAVSKLYFPGTDTLDKKYDIEIKEFAEIFNLSYDAAYTEILQAVKSIKERSLKVKTKLIRTSAENSTISIISWFDEITYDPSWAHITIEWSEGLLSIFSALGKSELYSKYFLQDTIQLKTIASNRLYRLLNKWLQKGEVVFSLPEFRRLMGFLDDEYERFSNLKAKVLEEGVYLINKNTSLQVNYSIEFNGKKAVAIRFKMNKKEQIKPVLVVIDSPEQIQKRKQLEAELDLELIPNAIYKNNEWVSPC